MKSPILLLVFNRPESTRKVLQAIRAARPNRLYISADGPRSSRPNEAKICKEVRNISNEVDWPCEVKTFFHEKNLGCKIAVSSGIDWFFEHEEEGIILEDDVLPLPSFFAFCDEMLERYRESCRVAMISGCNLISRHSVTSDSYFFSRNIHIWGWATWRKQWQKYDIDMKDWPEWRDNGGLEIFGNRNDLFVDYWQREFNKVHCGLKDTWDYQWVFTCWKNNLLSVTSANNLTQNLGFGSDATHTISDTPPFVKLSKLESLSFPLNHPKTVARNHMAERLIDKEVFGLGILELLKYYCRTSPILAPFVKRLKDMISRAKV